MKKMKSGGGWPAILYTLKKSAEVGGVLKMYRALRSRNACKTCALGMGGQKGGLVNEAGSFPEVCKKSLQAMAADMQPAIPESFWRRHSIDHLRAMSPRQLEHSGRLTQPLYRGADQQHYQPVDWDFALSTVANRLKSSPADETFWYFSGRSSNEAGFLLQLFARLYGTNNVNNCSYYCHQASGVGLTSSIGSGTATVVLEDVEQADLVFIIGGNPPSNHPRIMTTLKNIRRRGGKVIVANTVRETGLINFRVPSDPLSLLFGTKIATQYVQPHIGGDLAMLWGIAKRIDELGATDTDFLSSHCDNADVWLDQVRSVEWSEIETKSGLSKQEISDMAETYATSQNCVFAWTMGITHHAHGVQNVQAIANLALMRGMVGRPQAGLMPIRGHSNVQGIGSVGVTPKLKDAIFDSLQAEFNVTLPTTTGLDTLACMEAADAGRIKVGFCLGGNLYGSNPDLRFAESALSKPDLMVYMNTTLNTGHAFGLGRETLILPVLARDEEPQPTTQESMFNFVRLSDGGPIRVPGPKSEVEVIATMGEQVLGSDGPIDWHAMRQTSRIQEAISKVVPGWKAINDIAQTKREFQIEGRTFHTPTFPTDTGRAKLHVHELPPLKGGENELRLMTVRSEGQFNTVVYEESDIYRGQERRDVILMHPDDLRRLNLKHDQPVTVRSSTGELQHILARGYEDIRPGNALMYYPEANILIARTADPKSKTPAFKGEVVSVHG